MKAKAHVCKWDNTPFGSPRIEEDGTIITAKTVNNIHLASYRKLSSKFHSMTDSKTSQTPSTAAIKMEGQDW